MEGFDCNLQKLRSTEKSLPMSHAISARANADLIDQKYAAWKQDPKSVDDTWAMFFEGFELGLTQPTPVGKNGAGSDPGT